MANMYCLDTSAFIESWWRLYRPSSFPSFWAKLEEAAVNRILIAPFTVMDELRRQEGDKLYAWALERKFMFLPLTTELQAAQACIINRFPRLINEAKNRSLCDPWVIALAQIHQCPVVTEENRGGDSRPKIPDVCDQLGIGWMKVADLVEALAWSF